MNTKIAIAIFGVALVAVALLGVTAAQFSGAENLSQTAPAYSQTGTNCINATTGELICLNNGTCTDTYCNATCTEANCNNTCTNQVCNQTCAGYCYNNTNTGTYQNQNGNCNGYNYGGFTQQNQNQNTYCCGTGITGKNSGYGRGCHP
jgi:hypothetical protein